nr:hypothetical protein [Tanacetum cinerariifolium]
MNNRRASYAKWLYDRPINSEVESKLRSFLVENADRILGIQPDSLFNAFSVTKGITAGMIHWLADKGKLKLDDHVANIWPEFGTNGKDQMKVNHVLTHSAGLHNALAGISDHNPDLYCNFDECLKRIAMVAPETEPGTKELYHYLSFGWLCGGIIERASGKKYQEVLEEAFTRPIGIEGEFYIGIPTGIKESRLATSDTAKVPSSFTFSMLVSEDGLKSLSSTRSLLEQLVDNRVQNLLTYCIMNNRRASYAKWLYDRPINSEVEAKLRSFLVENADRILGIQVCAYKDGKVTIDTSAGVLGIDDPRPVQPDSLFNAFSMACMARGNGGDAGGEPPQQPRRLPHHCE